MECSPVELCIFMQYAKDTGGSDNRCELGKAQNHHGVK